jgi:uncharacterized membrane protein YvlD (DUF360 family)
MPSVVKRLETVYEASEGLVTKILDAIVKFVKSVVKMMSDPMGAVVVVGFFIVVVAAGLFSYMVYMRVSGKDKYQ